MKLPKFIEKTILNSETVQKRIEQEKKVEEQEFNRKVVEEVQKAVKEAKKDWSIDTAKAIEKKFGKPRKFVSTYGKSNAENLMSSDYSSGKNYNTLSTLFSDSPGAIQSASRIRDAVIGGGYVIKREDGSKAGKKSDLKRLIDFFDSPNPDDTIETLLGVSLENYLAYGNFYWEVVPSKRGTKSSKKDVAELYNLDPVRMTILVDADKKKKGILEKIGYKQRVDASASSGIIYNLDEIFHVRRPNRRADLYGRAVLEDNMATLQLLLRALTYNINVLKNGGRPPIQLVLPADSTESDADSVSAWFEKNYMGAHNAGKTLIGFKGAKAEVLGVTPQEMAYLELLNYGLRLVAGQFGVPLHLVGFSEDSNRASSSEARRSFYLTTIYNLRKLISQKITREIIKDKMGIEGWRIDFKTAGLEESEASRRDFMTGRDKGLYTHNEARIAMGLLPIDEAWADKMYLVSTKNDAMIEIEKTIGAKSDASAPDSSSGDNSRGRGETDPENDDAIHDE